jgi:hypothetical protein
MRKEAKTGKLKTRKRQGQSKTEIIKDRKKYRQRDRATEK